MSIFPGTRLYALLLAVLAIVVAVLAVYVQALGGTLIWDDQFLIPGVPLKNPTNGSYAKTIGLV